MTMIVCDPATEDRIKAQRAESGVDQYDEVWDGVYVVSPQANNLHQKLSMRFAAMFQEVVDGDRLGQAYPAVNISDREDDWTKNYRIPDAVVFLEGTAARDMDTYWLGGPDFAVEVLSKGDRAREKFDFYAGVGVRELLLIERSPWRVELYRLDGGRLGLVGSSTPEDGAEVASAVLPLTFRMAPGQPRPTIECLHADGLRRWSV